MLKSLFCKDISVEYEFKSVKFKKIIDRLKMKIQRKVETQRNSKHYRRAQVHIDILNNYWMRSSRLWGIIKAEVCVICRSWRLRQITQTKALIIPHILREPNSIIVLLFICICEPFSWRSHLYFKFLYKQHKPFVFCIWHKQHKLVRRHKVV